MKRFLWLVFFISSLSANAQNGTEDTSSGPVISAVGKPNGTKSEIQINKDGGSLKSTDGMVELIIPAGAISKKTDISIQPITNLMTNGNGKAYRLEPSGIKFQKAMQLTFHYDEEEFKDSMQLLMGIAMQDDKGQWLSLKNFKLDTAAKTISGNITHFSDWSNFMKIKLYPTNARLKIKKQITLTIDLIASEDDDLMDLNSNEELSPLKKQTKKTFTTTWKANGIINGNSTIGKIDVGSEKTATYQAPAIVPNQNPVAVTADLKGLSYTSKVNGTSITFKELKLVSNILVYDNAYEVTMISKMECAAGSELGMGSFVDSGSFVVLVDGKNTRVVEKLNKNASANLDYAGKCEIKTLKAEYGDIHIKGVRNIRLIPGQSENEPPSVEIIFVHTPTKPPLLQITCPPIGKGRPTSMTTAQANAIAAMIPAFPQTIKFVAKEEEQVQEINGGCIYYKASIKQIKEN